MIPEFLVATLLIIQPAQAKRVALIMGGSGDPPAAEDTIFDASLREGVQVLKKTGFETTILYNGSHPAGRRTLTLAAGAKGEIPSFQPANIDAAIKNLEAQSFGPGDQVLIQIESHGIARPPGERCILTEAKTCWSPEALRTLRDKIEASGAQLAIMDNSCYSGLSLELAGPNTCVLTGADTQTVALSDHGAYFWRQVRESQKAKKETDLESIYLATRAYEGRRQPGAGSLYLSSPRISTQTDKILRPKEAKLLDLKRLDPDTPNNALNLRYKPSQLMIDAAPSCIADDLANQYRNLAEISGAVDANLDKELNALKAGIAQYNNARKELAAEIPKIEPSSQADLKIAPVAVPVHLLQVREEMLKKPRDKQRQFLSHLGFESTDLESFAALMEKTPRLSDINKLRNSSPAWKEYAQLKTSYDRKEKALEDAAQVVSDTRNAIFANLYERGRIRDNNACARFHL